MVLGPNTFDQDLGVSVSGRIGDTVWCDGANGTGDGVFSAGEGLANVSVSLFADSDCDDVADGAALASQDTGVDGAYLFSGLAVGAPSGPALCYVVQLDGTDPDLGSCDVPVTALSYAPDLQAGTPDDLTADFALEEQPRYTLGDQIFFDTNQDGLQDLGEPGVAGLSVNLYNSVDCSGAVLASAGPTAADGLYGFTDLLAGDYCVEFTGIPTGWTVSPAEQVTTPSTVTRQSPLTRRSHRFKTSFSMVMIRTKIWVFIGKAASATRSGVTVGSAWAMGCSPRARVCPVWA